MTQIKECPALLSKMTVTEHRYNECYVDNRCYLIALINRILFCLFGTRGCFLGDAKGSISIQQEREAIHAYTVAKDALLLETNQKTSDAFCQAFHKRAEQLLALDGTGAYASWEKACEQDVQNDAIFRQVLHYNVEQRYQIKLKELTTLLVLEHTTEQEPLKSAVEAYSLALQGYVEVNHLDSDSLYKRLDQDVLNMCQNISAYISLKAAIVKQLPLQDSDKRDALFLDSYSSACEREVCGREWSAFCAQENLVEQTLTNIARFVRQCETVYNELGERLKQSEAETGADRLRLCGLIVFHIFQYIDDNSSKLLEQASKLSEDHQEAVEHLLYLAKLFGCSEEDLKNLPDMSAFNNRQHVFFRILEMSKG